MGTLVVIRHAPKEYDNKDGRIPRYDSPILGVEWERSRTLFKEYIDSHDIKPTRIISSPYLRTRQTAEILSDIAKIDVEVNRYFSEFLGWNKDYGKEHFTDDTFIHKPFPPEKPHIFKKRVKQSFKYILRDMKEGDIVWVITHGYNIRTYLTAKNMKIDHPVYPSKGFIMSQENIKFL